MNITKVIFLDLYRKVHYFHDILRSTDLDKISVLSFSAIVFFTMNKEKKTQSNKILLKNLKYEEYETLMSLP